MKELLIVGTGGFAREVYWHAHNSLGYGTEFIIKGFLEGNIPLDHSKYSLLPAQVLENILNYKISQNDVFVLALANSRLKELFAGIIASNGGKFINLLHKTAMVSDTAKLGIGIILCQFTSISCNTVVGNHAMLNAYSSLGHDAVIGDYSSIMGHVDITGNVSVGTHTFWGSGSRALPSSKIGNYATVGAGSVVIRKVKDGKTVFGVPAMEI